MTGRAPLSVRVTARLLRARWLVRAPIWLYRGRLGVLFGRRLLMLEHIGRTSGRRRYVVLEVVDDSAGRFVVAAGFGRQAQWLRNVEAHPDVRVWVGARVAVPATARRLSPAEVAATLRRYATAHPRAWSRLAPVLERTLNARIDASGTSLPMVSLEPRATIAAAGPPS